VAATNTSPHLGHFIFLPSELAATFNLTSHSVHATTTLSAGAAAVVGCLGAALPFVSATNTRPQEHFTFLPRRLSATFNFLAHSGQVKRSDMGGNLG